MDSAEYMESSRQWAGRLCSRVWFDEDDPFRQACEKLFVELNLEKENYKKMEEQNGGQQKKTVKNTIPNSRLASYGDYSYDEARERLYNSEPPQYVYHDDAPDISVPGTEVWMCKQVEDEFRCLTRGTESNLTVLETFTIKPDIQTMFPCVVKHCQITGADKDTNNKIYIPNPSYTIDNLAELELCMSLCSTAGLWDQQHQTSATDHQHQHPVLTYRCGPGPVPGPAPPPSFYSKVPPESDVAWMKHKRYPILPPCNMLGNTAPVTAMPRPTQTPGSAPESMLKLLHSGHANRVKDFEEIASVTHGLSNIRGAMMDGNSEEGRRRGYNMITSTTTTTVLRSRPDSSASSHSSPQSSGGKSPLWSSKKKSRAIVNTSCQESGGAGASPSTPCPLYRRRLYRDVVIEPVVYEDLERQALEQWPSDDLFNSSGCRNGTQELEREAIEQYITQEKQ